MRIMKFFEFLKQLYNRFQLHEVSALGAQMTYYLILAFFPFLIFLLTIVSYTPITSELILDDLSQFLAADTYEMIDQFIHDTFSTSNTSLLSLGMIGTIWASSNGFMGIIRGLNKAYEIEENRPFWKARGLSIIITFGLILVIILNFVLLIYGRLIGEYLFSFFIFSDSFTTIWNIAQFVVPLTTMVLVFVLMYKITPNKSLAFKEVMPGALFAMIGWVVLSFLFAYYVNNFGNYSQVYGSIGGIIVLLLWLYISSIIILIGGEINATIASLRKKVT